MFSEKVCQTCLNNERSLHPVKNLEYLLRAVNIYVINDGGICWECKAIIDKFTKFKKKILKAQEILKDKTIENVYMGSLVSVNNNYMEIPPGDETCESEDVEETKENTDHMNIEVIQNSFNDGALERQSLHHEELKFEVQILSLEEQLKEIEIKRNSMKYMKMNFKCEKCGVGFLTSDVYEEHLRKHDNSSGPYVCEVCHLRFKSRLVLSQHALAHRRQFKCLVCGVSVKRWSQAVSHRRKCDNILDVAVCSYCSKVFSDSNSLTTHIKSVHKKERKYVCEQCSNTFSTKQRLQVHIRSHTGYKPFVCTQCNKSFTTASNLRSHASVHQSEKTYYCVECNTMYKTEKSLKKHLAESLKHLKDNHRRFACSDCSKRFNSESTLSSHVRVRHTTTYNCTSCDKVFTTNSNLKKHFRGVHANFIDMEHRGKEDELCGK